jgi:hypothetical protein
MLAVDAFTLRLDKGVAANATTKAARQERTRR